jgi:outer membrane protein TolC
MLSNTFDPFYIIGARLSWNIWDWNQTKNSKQILGLQNDILNTQREAFEQNLSIQLETYRSDIRKYDQMLKQDNDIIILRLNITKSAESQLDNGVITTSDYLGYVNDETRSKINKELHMIALIKAKIGYLTAQGKF